MSRSTAYKAFISYKHQDSTEFARRLELDLKRYAKPWHTRPMRVFRDENHLVPSSDLPKIIRAALQQSEFLILLASPDAAESKWVQDELEYWCRDLGRRENLLIILTSGSISVDSQNKVIDWGETDALPQLLSDYVHSVPLFVDLSWARTAETQSLKHTEYKRAINGISARLQGVDPNEMLGLELREYRRNWRWAAGAAVAMATLLVTAGLFGSRAYEEVTNRGLERTSEELATRARTAMSDNALAGLILSLDALEEAEIPDAVQALSTALSVNRVRGTLLGHTPETVAATFSPAGDVIGTVAADGTVQFWSTETKLRLFEFEGPMTDVDTISFSSSGDRVFVAGPPGICGWTVPDLEPLGCWTRESLLGATHAPDGRSIQLCGVGLEWVDIETGERSLFPGLESTLCGSVRFGSNGQMMAVALMPDEIENSGVIIVRSADDNLDIRRTDHTAGLPTQLSVSADGARLITVDSAMRVVLSDGLSGATLSTVEHDARVIDVGFSPGGKWATAFDADGHVSLFDTGMAGKITMLSLDSALTRGVTAVTLVNETPWIVVTGISGRAMVHDGDGRVLFQLSGGSEPINGLTFSPDTGTAVTFGAEDLIWDLSPTAALYTFWAHEGSTEAVRFCPATGSLLTGGADGVVRLSNLATSATSTPMSKHDDWVTWLACITGPNPRMLSAGLDGAIHVLGGEQRWTLDLHHDTNSEEDNAHWIWDASVSGDGGRAATVGQDGVLVVTQLVHPEIERRWTASDSALTSVALSADEKMVAVGDDAGAVYLYDPEIDQAQKILTQGHSIVELVFSPDEDLLLSVSADGTAKIIDLTLQAAAIEVQHDDPLTSGAFSANGRQFVTAGVDREAQVWDTESGELLHAFDEHLDAITVTRFVGTRRLITGSSDGRVRVWDLDSENLIAQLEFGVEVRALDVASNLRFVAIALADGRVVVWPCVVCGDIEDAKLLGYQIAASVLAAGRLDASGEAEQGE